ncbi:MAG: nucleotidyltransferase family protein [Bellilinea sp.]
MESKEIIALLRSHYPFLVREYGIRRIGLFGSYAKGKPHELSDIDLVIEFERPIGLRFVELAEYLEKVLGRKVDVLTPASLRGIRIPQVAKEIEESIVYV